LTRGSESRSPEKPGARPSHNRSSTSRSKSPAKPKGHPDRPAYIDASKSEVLEVIEHPDGLFKEDLHEITSDQKDSSDIEFVEGPAARKQLVRRAKGRAADIDGTDAPIVTKQVDRKGKGKAMEIEMPDPRDVRQENGKEDKGKTAFRDGGGRSDTRRASGSASPNKKTWPPHNPGPGSSGPRGQRTIDTDLDAAGISREGRPTSARIIRSSNLTQTGSVQMALCEDNKGTRRRVSASRLELRGSSGKLALVGPGGRESVLHVTSIMEAKVSGIVTMTVSGNNGQSCEKSDHPFISISVTLQNQMHMEARQGLVNMLEEGQRKSTQWYKLRASRRSTRYEDDDQGDHVLPLASRGGIDCIRLRISRIHQTPRGM
jgi:hypothetical protein